MRALRTSAARPRSDPAAAPPSPPSTDPTAAAIAAAQRGCPDGWRHLYAHSLGLVQALVRRHAGRRLLQREQPDDLVAEVLLQMVRALPTLEYRGERRFAGWIRRLVLSTLAARAHHHGASKRATVPLSLTVARVHDEGLSDQGVRSPDRGPDAALELRDEQALLLRQARHLEATERVLLELVAAHGAHMGSIAAVLGISTDAARMRWLRLRRKLRELCQRHRPAA